MITPLRFHRSLLTGVIALLGPSAVLFACATDNGDAVHGPQFGPVPERPDGTAGRDGPVVSEDGGPLPDGGGGDANDAAQPPVCTSGTVAVLAGGDTTLTGTAQINGGMWSGSAIAGGAALSAPSLVALGSGFVGLTQGASNALHSVTYTASWSAATPVGTLTTVATPALTLLGTKAQAVFLSGGADPNKFNRIENAGTSWTTAGDLVPQPPTTTPSAGTIAAAGAELWLAQDGQNNGLYIQKWDGAWGAAAGVVGAGTFSAAPPALAAITGKFDLVLLYPGKDAPNVIGYATRDATTKAWGNGSVTQGLAQTTEQMSVVQISASVVMVTFRGNNGKPYYMTGALGISSISWSTPAQLLPDSSTVDSPPSVAKGVCGDDAIAVYASAGQVKATRYRGTVWTAPEPVLGASGSRVSVATR